MEFYQNLRRAPKTLLAICALIAALQGASGNPTCHESVGRVGLAYLSTERPYYNHDNGNPSDFNPDGCTPVKLWYFGRHGTRYPATEDIEAMQTTIPLLFREILDAGDSSELCPETLEYFSGWKPRPDLNVSREGFLHSQGEYELSSIASRYIHRFPELFPHIFSNSSYYFKFTKFQRTEASAHSFASSIFGEDKLNTVYFPEPLPNDPILRFYSACPKWEKEVEENPEANKEHDLFVKSAVMNKTIFNVSRRSGLDRNLTLDEITIIYTTCSYETAWNNGTLSEWCVLFDLEDLKVMEYRADLGYYWIDGYGYRINWEQACTPFVDALGFFGEYLDGRNNSLDYRKVQAYFSHSEAILKMFARLGLFNGNNGQQQSMEIRHDNYEEMKDIYQWRSSHIDCMGSNMAFVMYTCNADTSESSSRHIGFFTQERPTGFPACGGKSFCPYDEFIAGLSKFTNDCDLERICRINSDSCS